MRIDIGLRTSPPSTYGAACGLVRKAASVCKTLANNCLEKKQCAAVISDENLAK